MSPEVFLDEILAKKYEKEIRLVDTLRRLIAGRNPIVPRWNRGRA